MFWKQLRLLLWKNWILRKRHWVRTLVEIIWPTFLFAILVGIRKSQTVTNTTECHYAARAMPSAGVYPWMKGIVCDLTNPCFPTEVPSEVAGQINYAPDGNATAGTLGTLSRFASDPTLVSNLASLNEELTVINNFGAKVLQSSADNLVPMTTIYDQSQLRAFLITLIATDVSDVITQSSVPFAQIGKLPLFFGQHASVCNSTALTQLLHPPPASPPSTGGELSTELCGLDAAQLTQLSVYLAANMQANEILSESSTKAFASGAISLSDSIQLYNAVSELRSSYDVILPVIRPLLDSVESRNGSSLFDNLLGSERGGAFNSFCGHPPNMTQSFLSLDNIGIDDFMSMMNRADSNRADGVAPGDGGDDFCTGLINFFEKNDDTRVFWDTFKPLLLGKVTYTPDTPLTREIMTKANASFVALGNIAKFGKEWSTDIAPRIYEAMESGATVETVRTSLDLLLGDNPIMDIIGPTLTYTDRDELERLDAFLSNDDRTTASTSSEMPSWRQTYNQVNQTIALVTKALTCIELDKYVGFPTETELVNASLTLVESKTLWAGVVFDLDTSDTELPPLIKYKIRQDASTATKTNTIQSFYWAPSSNENETTYYTTGFVALQDMIERALASIQARKQGASDPDYYVGVYMQEFPYPCYTRDEFLEYLSQLLSLLMTLAWVYSVCIIVKNIVYEKEQRLKEVMKMMGLSNGVHWVAWFINAFALMFISSVLLIIIMRTGSVTPYSNLFILLLWLSCFAFATISQCFLITCFFSRANLAAACAGIIYFVLYIPYNMVSTFNSKMTFGSKIIACLLSSVSFGYGASYISKYEMSGEGIQFDNWHKSADPTDDMSFLISLIMMIADGVIYLLIMWYVENVFPGTYGVPRPWYFFVTSSYWCGTHSSSDMDAYLNSSADMSSFDEAQLDDEVKVEKEPEGLPLGVSIDRMSKTYDNGKQALDRLSMNFYEGQITSFLGHNGAGKTTTMSILTGLFPASGGTARIYGDDIRVDMDSIRQKLGFCPQHNVLFDDLTVLEHLELYAGLKDAVGGSSNGGVDREEIEQMINDVGLPHKRHEMSSNLSGGMKRKLSVAVAFIGGSKCVILDEPTAGVDPYARRGIWDLLLKLRPNRTIMLSTHHMDEADLLGDRIAIISQGRLKCCGSSLFLKSCYGVGYYVTMVKDKRARVVNHVEDDKFVTIPGSDNPVIKDDEGFESEIASCAHSFSSQRSKASSTGKKLATVSATLSGSTSLYRTVTDVIPGAKLHEESSRELTFILPYSALTDKLYSKLFSKLDEMEIDYGVTDTSLEEIFLSVAEHPEEEDALESSDCCSCFPRRKKSSAKVNPPTNRQPGTISVRTGGSSAGSANPAFTSSDLPIDDDLGEQMATKFDSTQSQGSYRVTGKPLVMQQFKALFVKRFHYARRNRKGIVAQIIVPAIFVAIALIFTLIVPDIADYPPLELQPWMYGDTNVFFSNDAPTDPYANEVTDALLSKPGIGNRCVPGHQPLNWNEKLIECPAVSPDAMNWRFDDNIRDLSKSSGDNDTSVCVCSGPNTTVLLAECERGTDGDPTAKQTTWTSDVMYNMTDRNITDWLVKTVDLFLQERFGGLSIGATYHPFLNKTELEAVVTTMESALNRTYNGSLIEDYELFMRTENSKVWFDNNGFHSMPTWLNVLNNAALRSMIPTDPEKYGIVAMNHPLNLTKTNVDLAALTQSATNTLVALSIVFALSFVPASFVLFLIEERTSKAKHLQFISGVNPTVYWVSNFLWDLLNYSIPAFITVLIFLCFQTDAYVSAANLPCLITILLLYGFAVTPMMYPASFYFKVPSTAYVVLTCVNLFIGINTSIATFILEALDEPNLNVVNSYLTKIFLIFPQYCLGRGLIDMALNQAYADAYASFGMDTFRDPFSFTLVGRNMLALAIEGVGFFIIALLFQYNFFIKSGDRYDGKMATRIAERKEAAPGEDDDVMREKARVAACADGDEVLQIRKLTKIYKTRGSKEPLVAVDSMSVGVPKGECFGLLGVNGAGKTTTFQMLTGDTTPSGGDAMVCGHSVVSGIHDVQKNTGYCPQFEALSSMLTGYEHLELYARLRGVPPQDIGRVAAWGVNSFGLKHYASKPAGTYSGGNKRKLSAAIAFIGRPSIVFLDEPTAGMDPLSRRFLWSRISEAVKGGQCVVLTSHSMEECEALCTRLAIMVNGRFRCIGTAQHLKNRYGKGYTFSLKVGGDGRTVDDVKRFIHKSFPQAFLKETHCNMLLYQLPLDEVRLSHLFDTLEQNKTALNIEDYSISQTTLDEVFVGFAKMQTDGTELDDVKEMAPEILENGQLPESSGMCDIAMNKLPSERRPKCDVM